MGGADGEGMWRGGADGAGMWMGAGKLTVGDDGGGLRPATAVGAQRSSAGGV
jgi:hypothetical protein